MEWWQIFLGLFVFATAMFYLASFRDKHPRSKPLKKGAITVINRNQNFGREFESETNSSGQLNVMPKDYLQTFGSAAAEDDQDENFLASVPRQINRRINKRQIKKTLREDVEIGKLQVEHIENANKFYDGAFALQSKEKTHELSSLELEHKIQAKKSDIGDLSQQQELKKLRNEAERLDLQIDIAEKQARLKQLNNPQPASKPTPALTLKEQIEREELNLSKLKRERLGTLIDISREREYDDLTEREQAEYDETSIEYDARIHTLKEKIEKLRAKAG
jgi:hypothetical protein